MEKWRKPMSTSSCEEYEILSPNSIIRTQEEIIRRIEELKKRIDGNDVWIHNGFSQIPDPASQQTRDVFMGKLLELEWILGKDVRVNDGVY
jgi:hypothetical protein